MLPMGLAAIVLFLLTVYFYPRSKTAPVSTSTFEGSIVAANGPTIGTSSAAPAACPAGSGFRALGSYHPVGGIVVKCGCRHPSGISLVPFLAELYHFSRKRLPEVPYTLVVDRSCVTSCYSAFLQEVGASPQFNTVFIESDSRTDFFAQDAYISGVRGAKNENVLLAQKQNLGAGFRNVATFSLEEALSKGDLKSEGYYSALDDRGGNILPLPGNLLLVGDTLSKELESYLSREGAKVLRVDVKNLPARHVDEIFAVVRLPKSEQPAPCDFLLVRASPRLATQILGTKMSPDDQAHERMIEQNLIRAQAEIKASLGCRKNIPVLSFPIQWLPYQEGAATLFKNAWPNPVNAQILNSALLIPDPKRAELRAHISENLRKYHLEHEFMASDDIDKLYGGIHCASKTLHLCASPN